MLSSDDDSVAFWLNNAMVWAKKRMAWGSNHTVFVPKDLFFGA